jgi:hypothetical protein
MTCNTAKTATPPKQCVFAKQKDVTAFIVWLQQAESQVDVSLQPSHAIHLKAQGVAALQEEHTD